MVEGVRYLIIKCSKLNNPPPLQISLQMRAILSSLYSWCRIWKGGGNCVKTQLYCSSQPPPDLYALAADKTATQHIAKSHHSWQHLPHRKYVATHILPNIATSRLKAGAPSSGNILPFSSSYLFSNCKIHLCHHSFCASLPSFAICRFILSNYFDVKFASFSYHFHWFPLCVPLYYFYKNKASILIHQLNVVCMRFLNI